MTQLSDILQFMLDQFLAIWPYLLITIPLAVAVSMSNASRYIKRAFQAQPLLAILLATLVGAFSPFCSCSVIPVVASLLIGGVPLAPVMAFWVASPSMDPEIFFLSVGMLGWELALWRLLGTLALSLAAGLVTYLLTQQGWLAGDILRRQEPVAARGTMELLREGWQRLRTGVVLALTSRESEQLAPAGAPISLAIAAAAPASACGDGSDGTSCTVPRPAAPAAACSSAGSEDAGCASETPPPPSLSRRLLSETWTATRLVAQFMALAFLLEALITLYVPQEWIIGLLGGDKAWAVPLAALLGVPVYTSNLTALPLISGLLANGMNPGAALAFLIAGPTTTLPAMAAVYGLVQRRVFALYVLLALVGAVVLGFAYSLTV